MKIIQFLFFVISFLNTCSAQVRNNYRQVPTGAVYGSIYNASQWANLNDFTINGCTASASSNNINISSVSDGTNSQTLDYNYYTCLEYWRVFVRFTINSSVTSTSWGLATGIRSFSGANASLYANFITNTDATYGGHLLIASLYPSPANLVVSTGTLSFSNGDSIELTIERNGNQIYATARNASTNSAVLTVSYTMVTDVVGSALLPNTGKFSLFARGGTQIVDSLNIVSREIIRPKLMLIGDSKTVGYYASWYSRWASLFKSGLNSLVVHAGGGDRTADMLNDTTEIINGNPEQVLIEGGTNDPDSTTTKTNLALLVTTLQNHGITVSQTCFYQSSTSNLWRWNWLQRTYPANTLINNYNNLQVAGALNADGVHPTNYGDSLINNAIVAANLFNGGTSYSSSNVLNTSNQWQGMNRFNNTVQVNTSNTFDDFNASTVGATQYNLRTFSTDNNTYGMYASSRGTTIASFTGTSIFFRINSTDVGSFDNSGGNFKVNILGTGALYSNSGTLTNTNPSDIRLKNSINNYRYGLREILLLRPKQYYYNSDTKYSDLNAGFLAQDVQKVMPLMVREDNKGYLGLKSDMIIPALVNAIQEMQKEIDDLKRQLIKR